MFQIKHGPRPKHKDRYKIDTVLKFKIQHDCFFPLMPFQQNKKKKVKKQIEKL